MAKWHLYINATVSSDCEPEYISSHESLKEAVAEDRRQYQVAVDLEMMPSMESVPTEVSQGDLTKYDYAFFEIPDEDTAENFIFISKTPNENFFVIRSGTQEEEESYLYDY